MIFISKISFAFFCFFYKSTYSQAKPDEATNIEKSWAALSPSYHHRVKASMKVGRQTGKKGVSTALWPIMFIRILAATKVRNYFP